jgi:hypothetical protein
MISVQNIQAVIRRHQKPYPLLVEEETEGEYIDGVYVPGNEATTEIHLCLMPLSDKEIQSLPEGQRTMEPLKFFTTAPIQGKERFYRDGKIYTIESFSKWTSHVEGRAVRTA